MLRGKIDNLHRKVLKRKPVKALPKIAVVDWDGEITVDGEVVQELPSDCDFVVVYTSQEEEA